MYSIKKLFGKKITSFAPDGVHFEDNSKLASDLTLFIPAGSGHPVLAASDLPLNEAGFVQVDDTGLVKSTNNVYAIGDVAALEGPEWIAKQGHIAELMGRNAAFNIIHTEKGLPAQHGYKAHLNIICVMDTGNGAAFVLRNLRRSVLIPMPIVGHWLKNGWGYYAKFTSLGIIPRLPGM
jgi:sulfide:quinone oxidoreductase